MSIPKPGEYGEPWDESDYYRETYPMVFGEHSLPIPAFNRAMACVNAMNGRDAEKLSGLEDAIRSAWIARKQQPALPVPIGLDVIFAAARAFGTIKE